MEHIDQYGKACNASEGKNRFVDIIISHSFGLLKALSTFKKKFFINNIIKNKT